MDYETVCKYVGRLFLETQRVQDSAEQLRQSLSRAERERDEALEALKRALHPTPASPAHPEA